MTKRKIFVNPISLKKDKIRILDQTKLPIEVRYQDCKNVRDVWEAIRGLKVRGAPLIGIAGALGFLLGLQKTKAKGEEAFLEEARRLKAYLNSSRPTAFKNAAHRPSA